MPATEEEKAMVLKLARASKSGPEITEATGLNRNQVAGICHKAGVKIGQGKNAPGLWDIYFPPNHLPGNNQCKWPSGGSGKTDPIRFLCENQKVGKQSYCYEHARVSVGYTRRTA